MTKRVGKSLKLWCKLRGLIRAGGYGSPAWQLLDRREAALFAALTPAEADAWGAVAMSLLRLEEAPE